MKLELAQSMLYHTNFSIQAISIFRPFLKSRPVSHLHNTAAKAPARKFIAFLLKKALWVVLII